MFALKVFVSRLNCLGKSECFRVNRLNIRYVTGCRLSPNFQNSRSLTCIRFYSEQSRDDNQRKHDNQNKPSPINGFHSRFGNYIFGKFYIYVKGYEKILETRFPRAFKVYQIFAVGLKQFYRDIKLYGSLTIRLNTGVKLHQFSRLEIENYYMMPREILRVAPVLLISALPFANYVIFPLAYMFPKKLLSSHFWSIQQKVDFSLQDHKQKLLNYRPVFRHLQAKVGSIADSEIREKCANILFKLGSGTHPSVSEILAIKVLFSSEPFSISQLSFSHISGLCRMHNFSVLGLRKRRLRQHAAIIRQMDLAILREQLQTMNLEELRGSCFLRGVNPIGMAKEDMLSWLSDWIEVSRQLDDNSLSLLLHCPILLSYNYRTNWSLIH